MEFVAKSATISLPLHHQTQWQLDNEDKIFNQHFIS